jgi:hypothetical protein
MLEDNYNNITRIIDSNDYTGLQYSTNGTEWISFNDGDSVQIPGNSESIQVKVITKDDTIKEGNEQLTLNATTNDQGVYNNSQTVSSNDVSIVDSETKVELSINDISINEKDGYAEYTVSISEATQHQVTFNYETLAGTAIAGKDFTAVSSNASINAGETSTTIRIALTDDFTIENAENFRVLLSNQSENATITKSLGTATLVDEATLFGTDESKASESIVSISQANSTILEGTVSGTYTVSITNAPLHDLIVELEYTGVAENGTDFTGVTSVTILAGETSATFTIDTSSFDDSLKEGVETFNITIKDDQFAIGESGLEKIVLSDTNGSVTTSILDNDLKIVDFTSTTIDGTYGLGDSIHITVNLDTTVKAGSTMTVTLDTGDQVVLTTSADGTALSGSYVVGNGDFTNDLSIKNINAVNLTHEFNGEDRVTTHVASLNSDYENLDIDRDIKVSLDTPTITNIDDSGDNTDNTISIDGTAYANATVEIYGTFTNVIKDENNNDILGTEESRVLLGTVTADSHGNWTYDGTFDVGVYDIVAQTTVTNLDGEKGNSSDSNDARVLVGDENYDIYNKTEGDLSSNIPMSGSINYVSAGHNKDAITTGENVDIIDGGKQFGDIGNELEADSVYYTGSTDGITVDLRNLNTSNAIETQNDTKVSFAEGDILKNVENIYGSTKDDTFIMSSKAYFVSGDAGADTFVIAENGTYKISGGAGADTIILPGDASQYNAPVAIEGSVQGETNYVKVTSKDGVGHNITLIYQVDDLDTISYDNTIDVSNPASVGSYIDGAVVGMSYERVDVENGTGKTASNGEFEFNANETIKFTVGNIDVGIVDSNTISDNLLFLHDIVGIEGRDTDNANELQLKYLQNLAVFFQTIDADDNPYNNIVIKDSMITKINAAGTIDLKTVTYDELSAWLQTIEGIDANKVPSLDEAMIHVEDMVMKHTSNVKEHSDLVGTKIIEMAPTMFATATEGKYENGSFKLGIAEGESKSSSIFLEGSYSQAYIPTITISDQYGRVVVDSVEVTRLVHDNSDTTNRLWEFSADGLENGTYTITVTTKDLSSSIKVISGSGVDQDMQTIMDWADDSTNPANAPTLENYEKVLGSENVSSSDVSTLNEIIASLNSSDVNSLDEIKKLSNLVEIAKYAGSDGTEGNVSASDFEKAGISGVDENNLADILDVIKDLEIEDILNPETLQNITNSVNAQNVIENYAQDGNNPAPRVEDYIKAGVVGVNADNLNEVNEQVNNATKEQVNTLEKLQGVVNGATESIASMSKVVDYAVSNGENTEPDATDYANINVVIPSGTTVADVNEIIATLDKEDVDTVAEIDAIVDSVVALNKIEAYAENPENPKPTVIDYKTAGVIGVTSENLDEVNAAVNDRVKADVDTVEKLQGVINARVDSVYAINEIVQYADEDGKSTEPTLDTYEEAGVSGVNDKNLDEVNEKVASLNKEDVDSIGEINAVVESVNALNKIEDYANDSSRPIPTVLDYEEVGIVGVTAENINKVNEIVGAVSGDDVDSVEELQELINNGVASVNAISQIVEYADKNGMSEIPTLQTYKDARVSGVTVKNIDEINDRISSLDKENVDTKDEIKAIVDAVIALQKIEEYAHSDTNSTPTVQDYLTAGIIGVNSENIGKINDEISKATREEADTVSEVQSIVNSADSKAAVLAKIAAYVQDSVLNPAPTVSDYFDVGVAGVTEHNLASVNKVVDEAACNM